MTRSNRCITGRHRVWWRKRKQAPERVDEGIGTHGAAGRIDAGAGGDRHAELGSENGVRGWCRRAPGWNRGDHDARRGHMDGSGRRQWRRRGVDSNGKSGWSHQHSRRSTTETWRLLEGRGLEEEQAVIQTLRVDKRTSRGESVERQALARRGRHAIDFEGPEAECAPDTALGIEPQLEHRRVIAADAGFLQGQVKGAEYDTVQYDDGQQRHREGRATPSPAHHG